MLFHLFVNPYFCSTNNIKRPLILQQTFNTYIDSHFSFLKGKKLLLAISGGLDSMVLWHLCREYFSQIGVAHCNFQLRGEASFTDEAFVIQTAKDLSTAYYTTKFETEDYAKSHGISIQMAARKLRYQWFHQLQLDHDYDYVITAHHLDDSLETFLINLSRGTGLNGLTGIPAHKNKVARPLLKFSRNEIKSFANKNNILWREDQTNAETKYLRNKIRHDIVPQLKALNPNFMEAFTQTVAHLQDARSLVDTYLSQITKDIVSIKGDQIIISIDQLRQINNSKPFLYNYLTKFNFSDWTEIYHLLDAQSGKQIFSKTHRLLKDRNVLILSKKFEENSPIKSWYIEPYTTTIHIDSASFSINQQTTTLLHGQSWHENSGNIAYVDKNLLQYPLVVRKWEKGDYFYPLGLKGKKKISKFLKDEKLSLYEKEKIYLLCSQNDVVWVIGKRLDDRFKVTDSTSEIVIFKVS